jgi:hypothetical protein
MLHDPVAPGILQMGGSFWAICRISIALNPAQAARAVSDSQFGRRPYRFDVRAGTTTKLINSSNVQRHP